MTLRTASEGISFARELENRLGELYRAIVEQWPETRDALQPFIAQTAKSVSEVQRAYYEVITDAIEGGFCFELEPEDYPVPAAESLPSDRAGALARAIEAEETVCRFYEAAAEQSRGLLADVPRVFERLVKRRRARRSDLEKLAPEEEA